MKPYPNSNLKQHLIKFTALLMGICYLANPLQEQIWTVFHEVSHLLEPPHAVLSHHSHSSGPIDYAHHGGRHSLEVGHHEHALLDLLDSFFDASDHQQPDDETLLTFFTYDKHIRALEHSLTPAFLLLVPQNPCGRALQIQTGHFAVLDEPPQPFPPSL